MPGDRRLLAEIRRRRVLPAVLAYAAASFAAVEAADIYFPVIGLPEWTFRLLAVLSLLGLPVVIAVAWIFDFSWSGVRRTDPDEAAAPPAEPIGRRVPVSRASRVAVAGAAVVLALAAAAFVATREGVLPAKSGDDTTGGTGVLRFGVRQLTAEPGVEWFPSISPDGAWLVYAGAGVASRDILLRGVGGQNVINLTADSFDDDDQPAFSPDGQWIVFRSERDGGGLFLMGRTGEALRRLTRFGYHPAWSPDGRQIAFVTENVGLNPQNMDSSSELWVLDIEAGAMRRLESVIDAVAPSWSPNGSRISYFRRRADDAGVSGIWTVAVAEDTSAPVTDGAHLEWNPVWAHDGMHLYFASDRAGSMNLWRVPIDEATGAVRGVAEPIITPATSLAHISVSRDGTRLVYSSVLVTINVQRLPVDPATALPTGDPTWVTSGTRRWSSPDPSPDGRRIAMYSLTQPEGDLFVINADGTGLRQITGDTAVDRVPRWSPDGERIAFFSTRGGPLQLWTIRADGSELTQLTDLGTVGVWSPDGTRIATGTVRAHAYILDPSRPFAEQVPDTLWLTGVAGARFSPNDWSADGLRLAGSDGYGDTGIITYDITTGRYERLTDVGQWPVWLPDGRTLLFVAGGKAFYTIDRVTREQRRVFAVDHDVIGPPRLSREAGALYFSRRITESDVWMLTFEP
jgi:eukaryotic-like serine/threonine-protein kinase